MSYTELESGYQDLRQSSQQAQAQAQAAAIGGERNYQRPGFYLGHDGNGDSDLCESTDGMDSDCSNSSNSGKQVLVGICAMAKKTQSKPMKEILTRLQEFEFIKMLIFEEDVILKEPVENWPACDCLVSFHSKGFPLEKAIQYSQLRKPFVLNNLHMQYDIQDRRRVYAILQKEGIEIPRYAVLDRDSPDPKQHELIESEDHVEVNGIIFNKPFVEKPVSAEDHNIYIYYPTSAGGGSQRLFRKIGSRSSVYSPESRVRKTGSFIYEDFMPTDGTDVKVYTVGPDYAHAEARKSPALDGKVERDSEGKEIRYPVILNNSEKLISRKVCLAFKQTVCGFDLLRANGKSYVCDVNGFSFVKNSNKYYDDCAKILGNMILRELTPTLHIPWSVPFQLDDPPIVPTTFGKMMELRCVVAVIRHGDRTPKQKMKVEVRHPKFFEIFEKYEGYKNGHIKLKRPKQLQEILDIARYLLAEKQSRSGEIEIEEKQSKLEQLKNVLEMYGHFSGINRKVQMKYQPKGRPRGSSSDDVEAKIEPSLVLILKWGGELTPAGRIQAEELGRIFRCMYPGGQGRQDFSGTQGLGLLRLHSTFRHDLKIYASDEGRVQMTAAAFAKGLLALEGELTPILVQMVKSANTNGLLDNDCDSSKYQNIAKNRLHEMMQVDREFTLADRKAINPCNSISINQALDFVKNPVECCNHVNGLIKELLAIINVKKDDPKTKDAILYHGETWDLMGRRWEKIEKDFSTKSKLFDISKIPDIYDCIKYDLQHNQHTLQFDQAEEMYIYAKNLADIVIPQEYGLTKQEKLTIAQGICAPLLKKIQGDLQRNLEEVEDESVNRLNPHYSHGVASPGRHVRTRLYFTSESHLHSLLTMLRFGGLLDMLGDEQWRRAMDYISMVSELNYMSQVVIMLYEDPTKDPSSEERFHVELHFSPGVNCCVQKNLPPGPGFRPHSRNESSTTIKNDADEASNKNNPPRIDEEKELDDSPVKTQAEVRDTFLEEKSEDTFARKEARYKSKPIPIGSHHTVSGHEALDLVKRLNEELASQQQTKQLCSLETPRPLSPDDQPRSRSYELRHQKIKEELVETEIVAKPAAEASPVTSPSAVTPTNAEFKEIPTIRVANLNPSAFQIRVTDSLTFYKIDSSTNELPLSDIDFSQNPCTPDAENKSDASQDDLRQKRAQLLAMRRMESSDLPDFARKLQHLPNMSPLATNERPLSCNCLGGGAFEEHAPHSHSKSMADINNAANNCGESLTFGEVSAPMTITRLTAASFDDDFQLSCSAPGCIQSAEFKFRNKNDPPPKFLQVGSPNNSPTASTLKLCKDIEDVQQLRSAQQQQARFYGKPKPQRLNTFPALPPAQSAPIIVELANPFKFATTHTPLFVNQFAPIAENICTTQATNDTLSSSTSTSTSITTTITTTITTPTNTSCSVTQHTHTPQPHAQTALYTKPINIPAVVVTPTTPTLSIELPNANQLNLQLTTNPTTTCILPASASNSIMSSISPTSTTPTSTSSSTTTIADGNVNSVSSSSSVSVSSRRQRRGIAGQMSYMKMLGFGGFSRKMATSSSSLFSTAVISGSSSAPNLRDMIPCSVTSSVLEGYGGVPPIRPLETLHNALSLKQLDGYLQQMVTSPLFKTPAPSPPKQPSTPEPSIISFDVHCTCGHCHTEHELRRETCSACGRNLDRAQETSGESMAFSSSTVIPAGMKNSHKLAKFFPPLDEDLNSVSIYAPMNTDTLDVGQDAVFSSGGSDKSACLTPVSCGMDLSMIANKGSMTLSVDDFDDDDEATLSAATTPSLPTDEYKLDTYYGYPTHDEDAEDVDEVVIDFRTPLTIPETKIISSSPEANSTISPLQLHRIKAGAESHKHGRRKTSDPVAPKIQKQISLFEGGDLEQQRQGLSALHASINFPSSNPLALKLDSRLRKFENLTQSTSNSNFPFESDTLKRAPHNATQFVDVTQTQSCINLKSAVCASASTSACASPQHKLAFSMATQSCSTVSEAVAPRSGALVVKEKFIEPPKRISRSFRSKTQSMDADFLFNEFLLVPSQLPPYTCSSETSSASNSPSPSPSTRQTRFFAAKVVDDLAILSRK